MKAFVKFIFLYLLISMIDVSLAAGADINTAAKKTYSIKGTINIYKKGGRQTLRDLSNAVVYLDGFDSSVPPQAAVVDQRKKRFQPRVLPLVKGQDVHFYNRDRIDHNVFSSEPTELFDLGEYPKGEYRAHRFEQTGNFKVYCNIHKAMILDVLALNNPFFSVSNKAGEFRIDNIPAGDYQLKVWHMYGGTKTLELQIRSDQQLEQIDIVSEFRGGEIEDHRNKFGKKYTKKFRYRR